MSLCTVRLRLPGGSVSTVQLSADASFGALLEAVSAAAQQPADSLRLSAGFPPAPLLAADDVPIAGLVRNMDTVIVASAAATSAAVGLCGDSVGAFSIGVDWRVSILRIGEGAATGLGAGVGAF